MNAGRIKSIVTFVAIVAGPILGHFGLVAASVPTYLAVVLAAVVFVLGRWIFSIAANTKGWIPVVSVAALSAAAVAVVFMLGGSLQLAPIVLVDIALVVVAVVLAWWVKRSGAWSMDFKRSFAQMNMTNFPAAGGTDGTN